MNNQEAIIQLDYLKDFKTPDQVEALNMAIKALSEPSGDLIRRQAVLDGIDTYIYKAQSTGTQDDFYSFAELVVKALPPVKQEPKTGHWIINKEKSLARCSNCKFLLKDKDEIKLFGTFIQGYNYCPYCGAKMIESDCRDCKEYKDCPCGKDGHESGTSQGYSIGECKNFEPQESEEV